MDNKQNQENNENIIHTKKSSQKEPNVMQISNSNNVESKILLEEAFLYNEIDLEEIWSRKNCIPLFIFNYPFNLLNNFHSIKDKFYFLSVVLNNKAAIDSDKLIKLINNSDFVLSADGASNFLKDSSTKINYVTGDLDSINEETMSYLRENKITLEKNYCQDTTDLEKCFKKILYWIENINNIKNGDNYNIIVNNNNTTNTDNTSNDCSYLIINKSITDTLNVESQNKDKILCIYGSCGGRLDHSYSNLSTTFRYTNEINKHGFHVVSISQDSLTYYLKQEKISFVLNRNSLYMKTYHNNDDKLSNMKTDTNKKSRIYCSITAFNISTYKNNSDSINTKQNDKDSIANFYENVIDDESLIIKLLIDKYTFKLIKHKDNTQDFLYEEFYIDTEKLYSQNNQSNKETRESNYITLEFIKNTNIESDIILNIELDS